MDEQQFLIPHSLAQVILNYLVTRPYAEVFELVAALQGLKTLPDNTPSPRET